MVLNSSRMPLSMSARGGSKYPPRQPGTVNPKTRRAGEGPRDAFDGLKLELMGKGGGMKSTRFGGGGDDKKKVRMAAIQERNEKKAMRKKQQVRVGGGVGGALSFSLCVWGRNAVECRLLTARSSNDNNKNLARTSSSKSSSLNSVNPRTARRNQPSPTASPRW